MAFLSPYILTGLGSVALVFATLLFFSKEGGSSFRSLASMLIIFAIECGFAVFMITQGYRTHAHLIGWSRSLIFLYGPLIYLTFSFITGSDTKIKPDHFFHFLPFTAHLLLMIPFFLKTGATKIFLYEHYVKGIAYLEFFPHFMLFAKMFFFAVYSIVPILLVMKYKKTVTSFYSTIDTGKILKLYALSIYAIGLSLYLGYKFYWYITGPSFVRPDIPYHFLYYLGGFLLVMAFLTIHDTSFLKCTISTPDLIFDIDDDDKGEVDGNDEKYRKNKLPDDIAKNSLKLLEKVMAEEKPFTDSNLTLPDLAKMVHLKPYHLSQLINSRIGENFYVFINSARIKYAAELLKDPEHKEKSILEIAYMSGFNSKSAFNTYFKNITGKTPSNFKNKA
jgi:AraC-like DNA-binding protein